MKKESLLVLDQNIPYSVRISKRAQRMRVAVYVDGDVVVTKPVDTSKDKLKMFVEAKKHWILKKLEVNTTTAIAELQENNPEHFSTHKDEAYKLVTRKVSKWNKKLNYKYGKIAVKQLKSRWGSCSHNGSLSFNYKILFLPESLQDYVIVHELCHLRHPDHSAKFWCLVANTLPEYTELKKKIRSIQ